MANVLIGMTILDGENKTRNIVIHADPATINTVGLAQAVIVALTAAVEPCIIGEVSDAYVQFPLTVVSGQSANANSRVDSGGNLTFEDAIGKQYSVYIPTLSNAKVVNGLVNIDDAEVIDLGEVFTETAGIRTPHQHDLVTLIGGKQVN